jgi:transposase-like protein
LVKVSSGRGSLQQYREEFKKEAVEYSLSPGKTVEEVTRDLGIAESNFKTLESQY